MEKLFWGKCWGSCEPQQILGGEFLEKCQKRGEKLFGGSKKWWEFFWGSQQFFGGEFFGKKKENPRGDSLENFKKKNLGGIF